MIETTSDVRISIESPPSCTGIEVVAVLIILALAYSIQFNKIIE